MVLFALRAMFKSLFLSAYLFGQEILGVEGRLILGPDISDHYLFNNSKCNLLKSQVLELGFPVLAMHAQ